MWLKNAFSVLGVRQSSVLIWVLLLASPVSFAELLGLPEGICLLIYKIGVAFCRNASSLKAGTSVCFICSYILVPRTVPDTE